MKKPYYSQSVRMGIRSIVARIVPTTVDEIAAISYLIERETKHTESARIRSNSHGCGKAGAYSPVSAPAAPSATASHALAEPAATADDIFVIPAGARIAAVKTPKGEVWRVDIDGREQPIAVRDPSIASGIEANLAFSEPTYCRLTNDGRRDIVTEIVKAPSEVSA